MRKIDKNNWCITDKRMTDEQYMTVCQYLVANYMEGRFPKKIKEFADGRGVEEHLRLFNYIGVVDGMFTGDTHSKGLLCFEDCSIIPYAELEQYIMKANKWIQWEGGDCPVDDDALVQVEFAGGVTEQRPASKYRWSVSGNMFDIIRYRVVSDLTDEGKVQITTLPKEKPVSIDDMIIKLNNAQLELDHIESRKNSIDKSIKELTARIESELEDGTGMAWTAVIEDSGNDDNHIPEGVDVDDPDTWQDGDIIECVELFKRGVWRWFTVGKRYEYEQNGLGIHCVAVDDEGDRCCFTEDAKFRFVSRGDKK